MTTPEITATSAQALSPAHFNYLTRPASCGSGLGLEAGDLEKFCPLDAGRLPRDIIGSPRDSRPSLGRLGLLPPEILAPILSACNTYTIVQLRRVNSTLREEIDALPPYERLIKFAPALLRAVLATETSPHTTCADLWEAAATQSCALCGDFADFINVLTFRRVCFRCGANHPSMHALTLMAARVEYGLNAFTLQTVPTMHTVHNRATRSHSLPDTRIHLLDKQHVRQNAMDLYGSEHAMNNALQWKYGSARAARLVPSVHSPSARADSAVRGPLRFLHLVAVPWRDGKTGDVETGRGCVACGERGGSMTSQGTALDPDRRFSRRTYAEHFAECEGSKRAARELGIT